MLGVADGLDVLSPSSAGSRRHFLPAGNCRREGQDSFLPVGNSARILLTTYLAYALVLKGAGKPPRERRSGARCQVSGARDGCWELGAGENLQTSAPKTKNPAPRAQPQNPESPLLATMCMKKQGLGRNLRDFCEIISYSMQSIYRTGRVRGRKKGGIKKCNLVSRCY